MRRTRIPGLKQYQHRHKLGRFEDLPPEARLRAHWLLGKFCARWRGNLPRWRYAILVGQARRLALNPPDSAWGRSMAAKKGGYAVQRKYRMEGRQPTEYANLVRVLKQKAKKRAAY